MPKVTYNYYIGRDPVAGWWVMSAKTEVRRLCENLNDCLYQIYRK